MSVAKAVITMTIILVLAYLVLTNWKGGVALIKQGGSSYAGVVGALQGRK